MPRKVGFAIIGCGNIGPVHAAAIAAVPQAKLVAVSDVVEATAKKLGEQYGVPWFIDYRKMLELREVEAVCLCIPSGLRMDVAIDCAAAGKHILSEKPLEVTTKKIDRILAATTKAGVKLGCIFQSRFADGSQLVREALDQGRFGKLVLGDAYIKWYRSPQYYASGKWRGTKALDGGGALMNQGIHQIDLLQWFMGPVVTVKAQTKRALHEQLEVEDLAVALLEFENGAYGVIEGSTAIWPGHPARVEVHGTRGSVVLEDGAIKFWQFDLPAPVDKKVKKLMARESELGTGAGDPLAGLKIEGHRRQIEDFAKAILQDRPPRIEGHEGRNAVAIIEAIYRAAETGKTVRLK